MYRHLRYSFAVAVFILAAASAFAQAAPPTSLETYLKSHYAARKAKVAAFDHNERNWTVYDWDGSCLKHADGPKEKPEIALRTKEQLLTFIVHTNPLIFTADRSATAEALIDNLATLQTLASLLGSVAGAGLQVRGQDLANLAFRAADPKSDTAAMAQDYRRRIGRRDLLGIRKLVNSSVSQELIDLIPLADAYQQELKNLSGTLDDKPVTELAAEARTLAAKIDAINNGQLIAWLQAVESNIPLNHRPAPPQVATYDQLAVSFQDIAQKRTALAQVALPCFDTIGAIASMVLTKRTPLVGVGSTQALDAFFKTGREVIQNMQNDHCSPSQASAATDLVEWLLRYPPTADGVGDPGERAVLEALTDTMAPFGKRAAEQSAALETSKKILDSQSSVFPALAQVQQFLGRADGLGGIDPADGVIEVRRSSFTGDTIVWSKQRTDTVEVAVDESLKGKITLRHPEKAEGSFIARRKFSDGLEADFAVIKTELFSSTFEAKDEDGEDGGTSKIQETDRTTRSGKVAVMASYRFPLGGGFALGPQLGAGVDTSDASLFLGLSLRWRFLALGGGTTFQKVTRLRGQEVGQILDEGVALKTHDKFKSKLYFSLAITITDLPFFKPKD
jgi:hypothetical protein